eukprot:scaffold137077_cov250-Phaeocystis_antarctica.AAC.1
MRAVCSARSTGLQYTRLSLHTGSSKRLGFEGCDAASGAVRRNTAHLRLSATACVSASPATSTCLTAEGTRASDITVGTADRKVSCSVPLSPSVSKALLSSRSIHLAPRTCANATDEWARA